MPTAAVLARRKELEDEAQEALAVLRKAGVWMTAWAVAQALGHDNGHQTRYPLDRLVQQGHAEQRDSLSTTNGFGRHYKAL